MLKNKRKFITSDIWLDRWVESLSPNNKLFWIFLISSSDASGLCKVSFREAEICTGVKYVEKDIKEILNGSNTSEDEFMAWRELASLYRLRGQLQESLNAQRNSFIALKIFSPETLFLLRRAQQAWQFAAAGIPEEGQLMIDDAKIYLDSNNNNLFKINVDIAEAMFNAEMNKTKSSLELLRDVSKSIANYIGRGSNDDISMFTGIVQYKNHNYVDAAKSMAIFLKQNPNNQTTFFASGT